MLWPLWDGMRTRLAASKASEQATRRVAPSFALRIAVLLLVFIIFFVGSIHTFSEIPDAQANYNEQNALVQRLLQLGATRIYSEYWTCNRLIFQSGEKIMCSALGNQLQPGFDRYQPFKDVVKAAPHPAYVFPSNSAQSAAFVKRQAVNKQPRYTHQVYENYDIYLPIISS